MPIRFRRENRSYLSPKRPIGAFRLATVGALSCPSSVNRLPEGVSEHVASESPALPTFYGGPSSSRAGKEYVEFLSSVTTEGRSPDSQAQSGYTHNLRKRTS